MEILKNSHHTLSFSDFRLLDFHFFPDFDLASVFGLNGFVEFIFWFGPLGVFWPPGFWFGLGFVYPLGWVHTLDWVWPVPMVLFGLHGLVWPSWFDLAPWTWFCSLYLIWPPWFDLAPWAWLAPSAWFDSLGLVWLSGLCLVAPWA